MATRKLVAIGIAVVLALVPGCLHRSASAASIQLVQVLTGLQSPVLVTNAGDGSNRLFIVEQGGVIKVLQPGSTSPTVFLDIKSRVLSGGERGLLGLTFHPDFPSNRRLFVDYTRQTDGATVIAEYHVSQGNPNVADSAEIQLLVIAQPFSNHNGGMVEFGPDGFLYIAMGDGGSANDPGNRAQNINDLLGKILRIDVDHASPNRLYSAPASNPFVGVPSSRDEIYAYGMRNPWRFSFDRETGQLYAGDVGQGAVEEIDIVTLGGNYGWRIWEGSSCTINDPGLCNTAGFIFPIAQYGHTLGRCSVTGGYVYRGSQSSMPAGAYVYADFCTGEIFMLQNGTSALALDTGLSISSFGEDESGEVYVVGLGGTVDRIASVNSPPQPVSVTPSSGSTVSPTLSYVFSDASGFADMSSAQLLINGTLSAVNGCYMYVGPSSKALWLNTDVGTQWLGPITLGAAGTLQNSQCSIDAAGSSVAGSGSNLTINVALTFKPAFSGAKTTFMLVTDSANQSSGWQAKGTWTVPGSNPAPTAASVTPSTGSGSSTFSYLFSDGSGFANIASTQLLINSTLSAVNGCYMYVAPSNALWLNTDGGTQWLGPITLGAPGTLQNSQCSINAAGSSVAGSGNNLTITIALTFKPAFSGTKTNFMLVTDSANQSSGWQTKGTWTVP